MKQTHDCKCVNVSVTGTVVIVLAEGDGKWNRQGRMYKRKRVTLYVVGRSIGKKKQNSKNGERRRC